ncbi:hypothetical protein, partial [Leptospira soteropolitanensis]
NRSFGVNWQYFIQFPFVSQLQEICFWCASQPLILLHLLVESASLNTLTFTDDYYKLLKINKPIDKPQWQSRRDYLIPSLNRDEK